MNILSVFYMTYNCLLASAIQLIKMSSQITSICNKKNRLLVLISEVNVR